MIKDVVIKEPIKRKTIKEGYYVDIDFMYGDADGYVKKTYGPFSEKEKEYLIHFLNTLEQCLNAFPRGRGGFDMYHDKVEELKIWDCSYDEDCSIDIDDDFFNIVERIGFEWELCPDDWGCQASIRSYNVKFFNTLDNQYYKVECIV